MIKKYKIVVGTTSVPKIEYLKEVLRDLKIKADIFSVLVESGVAEQPTTIKETERGSISRAKSAFEKIKDVDFSIGIEVGYHKEKNGLE